MNLAVAGQPIPFEVTLDAGLSFVALKVYDVTASYPGTLVATTAMVEYDDAAYGASFSGVANKSYVVSKAKYTDGTYTTRDTNYASGSDSIQVIASPTAPTVSQIVDGVLDEPTNLHTTPGSVGAAIGAKGTSGAAVTLAATTQGETFEVQQAQSVTFAVTNPEEVI